MAFLVQRTPYISQHAPLPSTQMVIRRYRSLEKKKYLKTYFAHGLFCKRLSRFDDEDEGLLQRAAVDPGLRGVLATQTDEGVEPASEKEFEEAFEEYHENARYQHFANCWRIGTDENNDIWSEYTDDDTMTEGCAVETTVGQLMQTLPLDPFDPSYEVKPSYIEGSDFRDMGRGITETPPEGMSLDNPGCDIRVGACRYQRRMNPGTAQPAGMRRSVPFFKGEDFDIEKEFRLLLNPYSSNVKFETGSDGTPKTFKPELDKRFRIFPVATRWMTNRLIMAPNADDEQYQKVNSWLDEFYNWPEKYRKLDVVHSSLSGEPLHRTHDYLAELAGQNDYDGSPDMANRFAREFVTKRDWGVWPLVDVVFLFTEDAGAIIEAYWHKEEDSAFPIDSYGHDNFQNIGVMRWTGPDTLSETWRNEEARETDHISFDP